MADSNGLLASRWLAGESSARAGARWCSSSCPTFVMPLARRWRVLARCGENAPRYEQPLQHWVCGITWEEWQRRHSLKRSAIAICFTATLQSMRKVRRFGLSLRKSVVLSRSVSALYEIIRLKKLASRLAVAPGHALKTKGTQTEFSRILKHAN